mmetsp:Transcript_13088/g.18525  ORF Transcript_13088/g.18525 Transcript_13088/m.18525 type:complete len:290 (+) Transcript_13088:269-1138(+)
MKCFQTYLTTVLAIGFVNYSNSFQMSMVSTPLRKRNTFGIPMPVPPPLGNNGVTGGLISNLAVVALKLRLAKESGVKVDVTASSSDVLLRGKVGPVTVTGRGWESGLGLSCRAIEATVNTCDIDMGRIVTDQKIRLTTPAMGNAMVALNSVDFGNFITHPLMKPPGLLGQSSEQLIFLKDGIQIDPVSRAVKFYGVLSDKKWEIVLTRGKGDQKAIIQANALSEAEGNESTAADLTQVLESFFNKMVFELDGTFLSFKDMMVTEKGQSPSVMLALDIKVKKFPSPGLEF